MGQTRKTAFRFHSLRGPGLAARAPRCYCTSFPFDFQNSSFELWPNGLSRFPHIRVSPDCPLLRVSMSLLPAGPWRGQRQLRDLTLLESPAVFASACRVAAPDSIVGVMSPVDGMQRPATLLTCHSLILHMTHCVPCRMMRVEESAACRTSATSLQPEAGNDHW